MATIRTVHPITDARDFLYPWMPESTFTLQELSEEERRIIPAIGGVEATFEDSSEHFNRFVRFLLLGSEGTEYVIALEHKSQLRSHVRSYKGVFKDRSGVSAADHLSFERRSDLDRISFELDVAVCTHLVGLIRPAPENVEDCLKWLLDSALSFALSSAAPLLSPEELSHGIVERVPKLPGPTCLNYARMVAWLCPQGARILRMTGWSTDETDTFQAFTVVEDLEALELSFRAAISATE